MTNYLFNRQPLVINVDLAEIIGLNESIILQQMNYWIEINKKANRNYYDGRYWTYNTYDDWQKQFPFWSVMTIRRIIAKLEELNLIIVGNYNKMKIDRTKWYTINQEQLSKIGLVPFVQNEQSIGSK